MGLVDVNPVHPEVRSSIVQLCLKEKCSSAFPACWINTEWRITYWCQAGISLSQHVSTTLCGQGWMRTGCTHHPLWPGLDEDRLYQPPFVARSVLWVHPLMVKVWIRGRGCWSLICSYDQCDHSYQELCVPLPLRLLLKVLCYSRTWVISCYR